jgi:acyl-CoA thioesterase FadM
VDISLRVEQVGRSSLSYGVTITHDGAQVAAARFVVVLVDDDGLPRSWSDDHRRLLLTAGAQPPEKLVSGNVSP